MTAEIESEECQLFGLIYVQDEQKNPFIIVRRWQKLMQVRIHS